MNPEQKQLTIPMAIVAAGAIIAIGIFLSGKTTAPAGQAEDPAPAETEDIEARAVESTDHILGNPNAKVTMIEYSDTECPYCKSFHPTMQKILDTYGKGGELAWVYRHFPLDELHPKARKEAEATECAAEQGGNKSFWDYLNLIFEVTPSNNGLEKAILPTLAEQIGLNKKSFETCLNSGKFADKIENDYQDGLKAGARGTPHIVFVVKNQVTERVRNRLLPLFEKYRDSRNGSLPLSFGQNERHVGISGAMPYQILKDTIDTLLRN